MNPKNLEILAYEESPLGPLCLRRRELLSSPGTVITEITLNHEFLMSSLHTDSERALAAGALALRSERGPDPVDGLRVWVGGLGLGYTAEAVLSSDRVASVDVIELLSQVIDWLEEGLVPLSSILTADARFRAIKGDAYAALAGPPTERYDIIVIDVDHSPDDRLGGGNAGFYSVPGLRLAKAHLNEGGVLGVWSYAESSPFADALREVFDDVRVESVAFENQSTGSVNEDWLFFAT